MKKYYCEYCEKSKKMITKEIIDDHIIGWDKDMKATQLCYDKYFVYIEVRNRQGYLRMTTDDNNCIESGENHKINYCPVCGRKLNEESEAE